MHCSTHTRSTTRLGDAHQLSHSGRSGAAGLGGRRRRPGTSGSRVRSAGRGSCFLRVLLIHRDATLAEAVLCCTTAPRPRTPTRPRAPLVPPVTRQPRPAGSQRCAPYASEQLAGQTCHPIIMASPPPANATSPTQAPPGEAVETPPWGWEAYYTTACIVAAFVLMLFDLAKVRERLAQSASLQTPARPRAPARRPRVASPRANNPRKLRRPGGAPICSRLPPCRARPA